MAAVAGSKGRLETRCSNAQPLQKQVLGNLLAERISSAEAAGTLVSSACIREVGIDTNMICNLACRYCYLQDRAEAQGSVPLDMLQGALEAMAIGGTKLFAFIGKEPLADGRAVDLLGRLAQFREHSDLSFRTGMVTNGTLVERWIDRLVEADLSYIDISVDGIDDFANRLRGDAVAERIHRGIEAVVKSPLRERFATASVLTGVNITGYAGFVTQMFDRGVVTCFASPVLRFALSNEVSDLAIGLDRIWRLVEDLDQAIGSVDSANQIIIDLPYKYSWALLRSGSALMADVIEDAYEAIYWQVPGTPVFLKLNPFSYSYWRALRITHDGQVIRNMDLAAHTDYAAVSAPLSRDGKTLGSIDHELAIPFIRDFIDRHAASNSGPLHERDLLGQFQRGRLVRAA